MGGDLASISDITEFKQWSRQTFVWGEWSAATKKGSSWKWADGAPWKTSFLKKKFDMSLLK